MTNLSPIWLVTGGARGLGRAIVETLLAAGHRVAATARKPERLAEFVERYGDRILALGLDVGDEAACIAAVDSTVARFGRIDRLVNNAGYGETAAVEDATSSAFRAQIDTNFYGVVSMSKAALPHMRRQGSGHIFQMSSLGGRMGTPGLSAYQSAKWAVGGFSTVLAQEVAPLGIKVTVLEPGGMRTDWAGASMHIPPVSAPYAPTVGAFVAMLQTYAGKEPTDPAKVARLLMQLAAMEEPPVRLLVGGDAVQYAAAAQTALHESDTRFRHLSESVAYDQ